MPEPLPQYKRRRLVTRVLGDAVSQFGFCHHAGAYFSRPRGPLLDAFFFQFSRSNFRFSITCGIDAPNLLLQIRGNAALGLESKYPSLTISRQITESDEFGCKYEDHIRNSAAKITTIFSTDVIPWLDNFHSSGDILAAYHRLEIGTDCPVESDAARKVVRWTIYGLMLYNNGRSSEAEPWLNCALQQWTASQKSADHEIEWARIIRSTGVGT